MPDSTDLAERGSLTAWRRYVRDRRRLVYWPGPWSIGEDAADQLIGRADDSDKLRYAIFERNLVVLSGDSGVGKSSLIGAGIVPGLRNDGFVVAVCNNWSGRLEPDAAEADEDATSKFLATKLARDLKDYHDISLTDAGVPGTELVEYLNKEYGSHAVIILDQFEELIRQQPELYWSVRKWVERVVDDPGIRVRIVISLRAEYDHHLVDLDVSPYRRFDWVVDPIRDPEYIAEIVRSGKFIRPYSEPGSAVRYEADPNVRVIDEDAVARVCELWQLAGGSDGSSRIRLLHLQAALFVLWNDSQGHAVGLNVVEAHFESAQEWRDARRRRNAAIRTKREAVAYFEWAIARVVAIHLELCREAIDATLPSGFKDKFLEEGALNSIVRMAEYLSSGGYKVDQDRVHLGQLVLANELRALGYYQDDATGAPERHAASLIDKFAAELVDAYGEDNALDWLSSPGRALRERLLGVVRADLDRERDNAGAGPLMGLAADSVLVEECRRYFFALEWLLAGELVRLSPSDDGKVIALSHDGFGHGLNDWADQNDSRPQTALTRLTESRGEVFDWSAARSADAVNNPLVAQPGAYVRQTNLRWRACRVVGVHFERVVFFACDFRGTSFAGCTFKGVTFVNCILDGVQFEDCTIVDGPTQLELELADGIRAERDLPSFIDPEPMDLIGDTIPLALDDQSDLDLYNHYRNDQVEGADVMFSRNAGVEAVPAKMLDLQMDRVAVLENGTRTEKDLLVSHVQTRRGEDVAVTARWEPQQGGLTMFGGRLSSLAFYACHFQSSDDPPSDAPPGVSLRHVAGTSLDFFEHTGGRLELYDAAVRGLSISTPIPSDPGEHRTVRGETEFRALECHLENVWFSTGLTGRARIARSVVWQLLNANPTDAGGFQVFLDEETPYGGVVNVTETSGIAALHRGFTTTDLGSVPFSEIDWFAFAIDYRSTDPRRSKSTSA